jgi:uncharacterized protein YneR
MQRAPRSDDKAAWSAVGGVMTVVMGTLVAASPLWPLWAVLALIGLYLTLAPLLRAWPWRRPLSTTEEWLQSRIEAAADLVRLTGEYGKRWYHEEMNTWDTENVEYLRREGGQAVINYREDPRTGCADGIYVPPVGLSEDDASRFFVNEQDRYYSQRLTWLKKTLRQLRRAK